jgi:hypothetical protein
MLSLHHKGIVMGQVAMQDDLLVRRKLEENIGDTVFFINMENRIVQVLEIAEPLPADVAVVERMHCHWSVPLRGVA